MEAIAKDKNGNGFGLGALVSYDNGKSKGIGVVREVWYTSDKNCMVKVSTCRTRVSTMYIEVVQLSRFKSEITSAFLKKGVMLSARELDSIAERLDHAMTLDQREKSEPVEEMIG